MKRIRTKIILLVVLSVMFSSLVIGVISVVAIQKTNSQRIDQLETKLLKGYDENIMNQVDIIVNELSAVTNQMDKGMLTKAEAELLAADIVRNATYGTNGYFWVDTIEGDNVVLLGREDVEGTNRLGLEDHFGNKIVQGFIELVNKDGAGYYDYYFPKPNETEPLQKRAYVRLFDR